MKFLQGLSSSYYGWAFHSESEEELLAMVPPVLRGEATWSELRRYGIGWWVRSNDTLRRLIEKVTKNYYTIEKVTAGSGGDVVKSLMWLTIQFV